MKLGVYLTFGISVKAITFIKDVGLVTIEGRGMIGIPGVAGRAFSSIAKANINILMISQSSSEQNICFVVQRAEESKSVHVLKKEFELEILKEKIEGITSKNSISVVSVVGSGMSGAPGIAGKIFSALGAMKINIILIAQGSSELNISFLIEQKNLNTALNCIHEEFSLGK